jgi:hypothetical protein
MLTATRDDQPHGHAVHYGHHVPPRTLGARFTSSVQLLGSLVGIPLALVGGYSTYHATFSPEGKCQALRANIVSMLDKKTDATTLRLLVQRDVVTFERDCAEVDADAAAAFKNLLASEKPAVAHRVMPPAKVEKTEAVVAQPPAKAEKTEKVEKREPVKREIVKRDAPAKDAAPKDAPVKEAAVQTEPPKQQLGAPPHPLVAPPPAAEKVAAPVPQADKQIEKILEEPKAVEAAPIEPQPAEAAPVETAAVQPEKANVDATWIASVRDVLRESASQPAAETTSDVAPKLGAPIDISPEPQLARDVAPPGSVGAGGSRPQAPRPPGLIPNAN